MTSVAEALFGNFNKKKGKSTIVNNTQFKKEERKSGLSQDRIDLLLGKTKPKNKQAKQTNCEKTETRKESIQRDTKSEPKIRPHENKNIVPKKQMVTNPKEKKLLKNLTNFTNINEVFEDIEVNKDYETIFIKSDKNAKKEEPPSTLFNNTKYKSKSIAEAKFLNQIDEINRQNELQEHKLLGKKHNGNNFSSKKNSSELIDKNYLLERKLAHRANDLTNSKQNIPQTFVRPLPVPLVKQAVKVRPAEEVKSQSNNPKKEIKMYPTNSTSVINQNICNKSNNNVEAQANFKAPIKSDNIKSISSLESRINKLKNNEINNFKNVNNINNLNKTPSSKFRDHPNERTQQKEKINSYQKQFTNNKTSEFRAPSNKNGLFSREDFEEEDDFIVKDDGDDEYRRYMSNINRKLRRGGQIYEDYSDDDLCEAGFDEIEDEEENTARIGAHEDWVEEMREKELMERKMKKNYHN